MIKETLFFCSLAFTDYKTSRYIIDHGNGYEQNSFILGQNKTNQILFHSGKCLIQGALLNTIKEPKKKKIVLVVTGIIASGFIVHNVREMNKIK